MVEKMDGGDKSKNKTNKNSGNIWIVIGLLASVGLVVVLLISSGAILTGNVVTEGNNPENSQTQENCKDVQVPYDYLEEYQETVPYSTQKCETKNLIYSIANSPSITNICNKESEVCYEQHWYGDSDCHTFCSDRTVFYSIDVNNLDEEQGSWSLDVIFYKGGEIYQTKPVTQFLYPKTTKTFGTQIRITGDGPSGDANQHFSTTHKLTSIPTKQICRDITDYKEVTKTRTITRYRAETVCN